MKDSDCVACAYPTAPKTALDCYCTNCNEEPRSVTACMANRAAYEKVCADVLLPCTAVICPPPPPPQCQKLMCVDAQ